MVLVAPALEMAEQEWGQLVDQSGNGIPTKTVTIKNPDGTNATHYADEDRASPLTTSVTTNAYGQLPRFIDPGTYDVVVSGGPTQRVIALHPAHADLDGGPSGMWQAGYNPSAEANPTQTNKWANIDCVVAVDRGQGNRLHIRSISASNINDPSEYVLRRGRAASSQDGYADGGPLLGIKKGQNIGFVGAQGLTMEGLSFQGFLGKIAWITEEDIRADTPSVTLASGITLPTDTITITGNLDSTLVNGANVAFHKAGRIKIAGNTITYSGRTATKFLGCSGGTGTIASGTAVTQTQIKSGGRWRVSTSRVGTNNRESRFQIQNDGQVIIGNAAIEAGVSDFFNLRGGGSRFSQLSDPSNLTATVVGTPGSTSYTYYVVGKGPDGTQTLAATITVANGPATLSDTNYIKLEWTGGKGIFAWDIIREASAGTPGTTGPIILDQPHFSTTENGTGTSKAVDNGKAVGGQNEKQTVTVENAQSGTWTLTYDGQVTGPIDYNATASAVDTALEALSNIGAGDVTVTGNADEYTIEFTGALAATNVSQLVADPSLLVNDPDDAEAELPAVTVRTTQRGQGTSYTKPTRNQTADVRHDGVVTFSQGTLGLFSTGTHAQRPAAGTAGRQYFETDTGVNYLDTGTIWQWLTPGRVRKTADETVNNSTTLQNDNELFFPIDANEVWLVEAILFLSLGAGGATADWKFNWTGPASASAQWGAVGQVATGGPWSAVETTALPGSRLSLASSLSIGAVSGGSHGAILVGRFSAAGTAGTIQLQWAQNTATVVDNIVQANSLLRLTRLA